jgi:MinD-like ATPase involved in chromosome partitioning or flagellar assembly
MAGLNPKSQTGKGYKQDMRKPEQDTSSHSITEFDNFFTDAEPNVEEISVESTNDVVIVEGPRVEVKPTKSPKSETVMVEEETVPAEVGFRGSWNRSVGRFLPKLKPSKKEQASRLAVSIVQSAAWDRPMNVVVANVKGGSGKTLTTVMLAEVLSDLRGGQVAAWEACEVRGTLADRVSDTAGNKGIPQFLDAADTIGSLHDASQYLAVQASHAHALTSPTPRAELRGIDVATMRRVLDTYFALTITDTGNNSLHPAWIAAVTSADVLVVPCMTTADSVKGALDTLAALEGFEDPAISSPDTGLRSRVIVVASSPSGSGQQSHALAPIRATGVRVIEMVPFDKTLARGTVVSIQGLDSATCNAWTQISADVVEALNEASGVPSSV